MEKDINALIDGIIKENKNDIQISGKHIELLPSKLLEVKELHHISIMDTKITDFRLLNEIKSLRTISIKSSEEVSTLNIENLSNLDKLDCLIEVNEIRLVNLTNLNTLILGDCVTLSNIAVNNTNNIECFHFQGVCLFEEEVSDLFSANPNIKDVWLNILEIKDISFLGALKNLEILTLHTYGMVSDISVITQLNSLKELHLGGNAIKDISCFENCKFHQIELINLSSNSIEDITPLFPILKESLTKDIRIYFSYNPISNPPPDVINEGTNAIVKYIEKKRKKWWKFW